MGSGGASLQGRLGPDRGMQQAPATSKGGTKAKPRPSLTSGRSWGPCVGPGVPHLGVLLPRCHREIGECRGETGQGSLSTEGRTRGYTGYELRDMAQAARQPGQWARAVTSRTVRRNTQNRTHGTGGSTLVPTSRGREGRRGRGGQGAAVCRPQNLHAESCTGHTALKSWHPKRKSQKKRQVTFTKTSDNHHFLTKSQASVEAPLKRLSCQKQRTSPMRGWGPSQQRGAEAGHWPWSHRPAHCRGSDQLPGSAPGCPQNLHPPLRPTQKGHPPAGEWVT